MNVSEFLEARIAEDEAVARRASPGPWSFADIASVGGGTIYDPTVAIANVSWDVEDINSPIRRTRPAWQADATGIHIARHNPARVLAECKAKRAIADLHGPVEDRGWQSGVAHDFLWCGSCGTLDDAPVPFPCETLEALASVYADHPDYRPEWARNAD